MVGAKQQETRDLSWFRPGSYVQQWCARGTVLLCTRVPVVGRLQVRRESRHGLQVPGEVIGTRCCGRIEERVCVVSYWMSDVSCPLRRGGSPSFYRPRRGSITSMPHYSATWGSMACSAVELAAILTVLTTILSSWCVLYPNSGRFEGRGVAVDRGVLKRARGSR
jgi:hypothetical protein